MDRPPVSAPSTMGADAPDPYEAGPGRTLGLLAADGGERGDPDRGLTLVQVARPERCTTGDVGGADWRCGCTLRS